MKIFEEGRLSRELMENIKHLFLYLLVGAIATITEWAIFQLLNAALLINYMISTTAAYIISTFVNWLAGRIIMFKSSENVIKEIIQIYLTGAIGLGLNLIIMWVAIERLGIGNFISKIIATGLVFSWNFFMRKLVIYRQKK